MIVASLPALDLFRLLSKFRLVGFRPRLHPIQPFFELVHHNAISEGNTTVPASLTESPCPRHHRRPVGVLACSGDVLLCLGAASWLVSFGLIEWSFPYCSSQADGPATAVFGFPLPFMRMSLVTSVTILFAPHGYLLDVALVGGALLALGSIVCARPPSMRARSFLGGLGGSAARDADAVARCSIGTGNRAARDLHRDETVR